VNEFLDVGPQGVMSRDAVERFEQETDPKALTTLALELNEEMDGDDEGRIARVARFGDGLHQEHALFALIGRSGTDAVDAMLAAADPSRPPMVADRALDALISVVDALEGQRREEARVRARLLADFGAISCRATALLLLTAMGLEGEDLPRVEFMSRHEDPRIALAAKRGWFEYFHGRGEHEKARPIWESMKLEGEKP